MGYEINFNRHFYKPQPMRSLEEISSFNRSCSSAISCSPSSGDSGTR